MKLKSVAEASSRSTGKNQRVSYQGDDFQMMIFYPILWTLTPVLVLGCGDAQN